jgi:hypothetical protein
MNKFLADAIGTANAILAVLIVIGSAIAAGNAGFRGFDPLQAAGGLVAGAIVAVIVCGVLALLVEMRRELVEISTRLERR